MSEGKHLNNIAVFSSRAELSAKENLNEFIEHCRNNLTLYSDCGGFDSNEWHFKDGERRFAMTFSKYKATSNPYHFEPLDEPFLTFAKSYVRYRQTEKQNKNIADTMVVLRTVHDALIEVYGAADIINVDGLVQETCFRLLNDRYPSADKLYFWGGKFVILYSFLTEKCITPSLPIWVNPWKKTKEKAARTDSVSQKWQEERCPSQHQMLALADCFAKAKTHQDKYWSSVLSLLMFAPGRGGELASLTINSLHEEDGRLAVRWFGEKGFGYTIKWVPEAMESTVREAVARLLEIGQPARDAAKFAYENPGKFYRHARCNTPSDFAEGMPLNPFQFAGAMDFTESVFYKLRQVVDQESHTAWNCLGLHSRWIKQLREGGNPSYEKLAKYVAAKYRTGNWPNLGKSGRPVWESLLLIRDREFHEEFLPRQFSWTMPTVNQLNDELSQRPMKNPISTIFQRFAIEDEDGAEISLTSHQLRVWLSTNAERGGMDSWKLAQWAGRARIEDNRHYDLRTQAEREEQVNSLMRLDSKPGVLELVKSRLPVSYADLGLNRIGVADVTLYGMCMHDYAMSPCTKGGQCMTCKEHVCIKGMPTTLERIKRLEAQVEAQLEKARRDEAGGVYGASVWEQHFAWKLAHIRTQRIILESEDVPEGAVLWIPPEHDPSPVERALQQQGYETKIDIKDQPDAELLANLLGVQSA